MSADIILASQSPRRHELLTRMGIPCFQTVSPQVDETELTAAAPAELVEGLSRRKADAVADGVPDAVVIAADTVVVLDGVVMGKPANTDEAVTMLSSLAGRSHQVYTGVTVRRGELVRTCHEVTEVTFRALTPGEIADYVKTGEPMDKAGAYGIQGYGSLLVTGIRGDYYNVMGLPVCRLAAMLGEFGVYPLQRAARE